MLKIRSVKKPVSVFMIVLILSISFLATPVQAYEDTDSESLDNVHINTLSKYLYLGDNRANSYDFNLVGIDQDKIEEYSWNIQTDKGNPDSVLIDRTTGEVTARKAGTAYIYCDIKQKDGTIRKPEAQVIVINDITEVQVSIPSEQTIITAGQPINFNRTIVNTSNGKGKRTEGITRWEITNDTAGAGSADSRGVVYPTEEGTFNIRAICFQDEFNYKRWLRKHDASLITAASDWQTIQVVASEGKAVANSQGQLEKALDTEEFKEIKLISKKPDTFTIGEYDYSDKTLIVDTPNADIHNHGRFQKIMVNAVKESTWIEYADGNIVYLLDTQLRFVIDAGSEVKQIVIDQADSVVNFEIHGLVDKISVIQPATVNLSGSVSNIPLTIEENAGQSVITTSVSVNLTLNADSKIILQQGSEDSSIDKSIKSITASVENQSIKPVAITTNHTGAEIIYGGASGISNETTLPTVPQGNNYVGVTGLTLTPKHMVLAVTGSSISMLVAITEPSNATDVPITWRSADESIATVDWDGVVTPVSEGTTPIIAETGGIYATAYVTVVSGSALAVSGSAIQTGLLQSVGSTIATELGKGAVAYLGGQLLGWGLKEAGIGFKDETTSALDRMNAKLDEISKQLINLENQLNEAVKKIENAIHKAEFNTRVGQMTELIGNIKSIREELNRFIAHPITNNPELLANSRQEIISNIKNKLISNENLIHDQLMGTGGQESLIKLYSRIIKGNNRFLSAKDSASVQTMYQYFEMAQTNMLELMVEYYHAIGEGGDNTNNISRILDTYTKNITAQNKLLLPSIPENVMIDTSRNIMVYTGDYYYTIPYLVDWFHIRYRRQNYYGPYYGNIDSQLTAFEGMCYQLNYDNWRLISYDELSSWRSASNGDLHGYLLNSINLSLDINKNIIIIIRHSGLFIENLVYYYGYSVANGKEVIDMTSFDGGKTYTDLTMNDATKYMFYYIVCRSMGTNELGSYFW